MFCGSKKFPSHFSVVCPSVCVESALIYGPVRHVDDSQPGAKRCLGLTLARRDLGTSPPSFSPEQGRSEGSAMPICCIVLTGAGRIFKDLTGF